MDPIKFKSFINLQDKLHQNICRRRSLASIGTHDLSKLKGPLVYMAEDRNTLKFHALKEKEVKSAHTLLEEYRESGYLKEYVSYLDGNVMVPVIKDSDGTVLSMPPIINSDNTKVEQDTKDIFIEITAKDENKARIVLNMLISNFSI